ncbi:hypothetical protein [Streptomyces sp. NPDC006971]|uniref:hypothetical protein n=1 Tax=Streptomyces sp. NPDC006971 TaxID=3154784 RepID=UPI0033E39CC2
MSRALARRRRAGPIGSAPATRWTGAELDAAFAAPADDEGPAVYQADALLADARAMR